jgi:glutamate synthase domain-containing protein 1
MVAGPAIPLPRPQRRINTVRGNTNWMKSHEIKMAATAFGEHSEDIKPLIPAGARHRRA